METLAYWLRTDWSNIKKIKGKNVPPPPLSTIGLSFKDPVLLLPIGSDAQRGCLRTNGTIGVNFSDIVAMSHHFAFLTRSHFS